MSVSKARVFATPQAYEQLMNAPDTDGALFAIREAVRRVLNNDDDGVQVVFAGYSNLALNIKPAQNPSDGLIIIISGDNFIRVHRNFYTLLESCIPLEIV